MNETYQQILWKQFCRRRLGFYALLVVGLFIIVGIYAPLLASSKPLFVEYQGKWYFPLFHYLFYPGFFSKKLDIFYNLLMFTLPLFLAATLFLKRYPHKKMWVYLGIGSIQLFVFLYLILFPPQNPAFTPPIRSTLNWHETVEEMPPYAQLNLLLRYQRYQIQHNHLMKYENVYKKQAEQRGQSLLFPTLWNLTYQQELDRIHEGSASNFNYEIERFKWLEQQQKELKYEIMPLFRPFHWEDDAGGDQLLNQYVKWGDLTRTNRKDMVAALIFGIRISLSVGLLAIGLALLIGVPIGAFAGFYGGKFDLITYRLIEIWESMPTFFMLLMIVAFLQSKSIFLVIAVIGFFGWTSFSRFIRGEFLRQKQLMYVEACRAVGYGDATIMFSHLLPNAIPPLLTLIPFAIMGAITSEAGLSFLGLGEEGSNSWGVLMDEGRTAFPAESYLLWPPAILLTVLLVSIALVGDALRDALDPKLHTV